MAGLEWGGGSVGARTITAFLAGAVAVTLSGCGARWETEPPVFPSPDAVTVARDSLADASAEVVEAAVREGADADDVAVDATAAAETHLDVLGGVYVAYPSATPSPEEDTTASPAPEPSLAEAIAAARATAASVAATTVDADLAFLARSIDLEWALREWWAAQEAAAEEAAAWADAAASASPTPPPTADDGSGEQPPSDADPVWFPLADGSIAVTPGFTPDESTVLAQATLTELALREDEARFAYETLAAQEFGPRRDDALGRARLHAERSDSFAALIDTDPRTPLYQVRDADLLDPDSRRVLERSVETDLATRYAALLDGAAPDDAAWLVNAAFDAYARAMRTDGFLATDVPTLPGLEVVRSAPPTASASAPATASIVPSPRAS
ncbi:hypothetical protein [Demequina sp.]|uniref:hypothetical protein n=1 Tax=Demequina sp. TaxID=2050685 RepID=UPI0025BA546B|nr:hypothetical protein [Demequina sp.]